MMYICTCTLALYIFRFLSDVLMQDYKHHQVIIGGYHVVIKGGWVRAMDQSGLLLHYGHLCKEATCPVWPDFDGLEEMLIFLT